MGLIALAGIGIILEGIKTLHVLPYPYTINSSPPSFNYNIDTFNIVRKSNYACWDFLLPNAKADFSSRIISDKFVIVILYV